MNFAYILVVTWFKKFEKIDPLHFPSNVSRTCALHGTLGPNVSDKGAFGGALDSISILDGTLDCTQVQTVFNEGPLLNGEWKQLGITLRPFLTIQPTDFIPPQTGSPIPTVSPDKKQIIQPQLEMDIHLTHSIKDEIRQIGGIQLVLPFLTISISSQLTGLRILCMFLEQCRKNMETFIKFKGFEVIGYLLIKSQFELSRETMDILMDMTSNRIQGAISNKHQFQSIEGIWTMLDLLREQRICNQKLRKYTLQQLSQALTYEINLNKWRGTNGPGMGTIIEWIRFSPEQTDLFPILLTILERILLVCKREEMEILLDFLATISEEGLQLIKEINGIFEALENTIRKRSELCQFLVPKDEFDYYIFHLFNFPSHSIHSNLLHILSLIFDKNSKSVSQFSRQNGYDIIYTFLSKHPLAKSTMEALIELAQGQPKSITSDRKDGKEMKKEENKKEENKKEENKKRRK